MSTFEIEGGVPLRGTVRASGNKNAILPIILSETRLHVGFLITLLIVAGAWVLVTRSLLGFQVRVIGSAPEAAHYAGIRPRHAFDGEERDRLWRDAMNVNLDGVRHTILAFQPQLAASKGSVVNIGSISASRAGSVVVFSSSIMRRSIRPMVGSFEGGW